VLFDLRGRGRRRTVRVIYTGLAVLMGVGLIGFGIGGGFGGGGLLTAASNNEGGSSASFSSQIKKYRKLTQEQPQNLGAWESLTKAMLHEAGSEAYVTSAGTVTPKGKALFNEVAQAWSSYIALNPPKPNAELAQLMESVYGEAGLNQPAKEVEILQIAVAARPTDAALFAALAESAYKARNTRVGDLAAAKAVRLAPAAEQARVKNELAEVRKNPSGEKLYETTTNGKTYVGKLNSKGELKEAHEVPPGSSTTGATSTTKTSTAKK
jgi:hypothetical protein